jgi:hypothetical protein
MVRAQRQRENNITPCVRVAVTRETGGRHSATAEISLSYKPAGRKQAQESTTPSFLLSLSASKQALARAEAEDRNPANTTSNHMTNACKCAKQTKTNVPIGEILEIDHTLREPSTAAAPQPHERARQVQLEKRENPLQQSAPGRKPEKSAQLTYLKF